MARVPEPRCPVRPGEPCTLCQVGATGPADCGLVYLVMHDPELRAGMLAGMTAGSAAERGHEWTVRPATA